jgi:arsenite methyltransferase
MSNITEAVKEKYGTLAKQAAKGAKASCCSTDGSCNSVTSDLYSSGETSARPAGAVLASLGCGNPTALAELKPGEVVLDLGSGGGIDVLLSARRVGPAGKAYGLDITDEMLELARENQKKAGVENVEFLRGEIENIPLPDGSVDVILSNCVINLSADKRRVLAEAFRVLKPGGRFAVSDIVLRKPLPPDVAQSLEAWAGCTAGALQETEYTTLLREAGFREVGVEPTRIYEEHDGALMSAFIRATK